MCPFCGRDPYHRTDSGEAVAVTCCDMGDLFFRGARSAPEQVTISWEDFEQVGLMLVECQTRIARAIETLDNGAPAIALSILNGAE
jgi:hypothetical protein